MSVKKIVNGKEVTLSGEEGDSILAEQALQAQESLKRNLREEATRIASEKVSALSADDTGERLAILMGAVLQLVNKLANSGLITVDGELAALRDNAVKIIAIRTHEATLKAQIDSDPSSVDVNQGWPEVQ